LPVGWIVKNVVFVFRKYVLFVLTLFLKVPLVAEDNAYKPPSFPYYKRLKNKGIRENG